MHRPHPDQSLSPLATSPHQQPEDLVVPPELTVPTAAAHATCPSTTWEATLGLTIRSEDDSKFDQLGAFPHVEDFELTRDTLLEIATSDRVLHNALVAVGPAPYNDRAVYPTDDDAADLRDSLRIVPPNGSENVSDDVLYLKVEDHDKTRAVDLAHAILEQLQNRSQELLGDKARDIVDDLRQKALVATADLKEAVDELSVVEKSVGSDLAGLRNIHVSPTNESDLHQKMIAVEDQLHETRSKVSELTQLRDVLTTAQQDPQDIVAMPNGLLESQPALQRLKDGLVDARSKVVDARSKVVAAQGAQSDVVEHISAELTTAVLGIDVQQRANQSHLESIEAQNSEIHDRFERLTGVRSEYSTLVDRVDHHTTLVKDARRNLTDARIVLANANDSQLICPVDDIEAGAAMIGQSRAIVVLSGLVGGMVLGWAMLFVSVAPAIQPAPANNEEISESLQHGIELPQADTQDDGDTIALPSYAQATASDGRI